MSNTTGISPFSTQYWLKDHWDLHGDPRVAHLPLMSSFLPWLLILGLYLTFVLYLGPRWMSTRPAFSLKRTLVVYNIFMSLSNAWFFYLVVVDPRELVRRLLDTRFPTFTTPSAAEATNIFHCYLYLLSKLVDLLDTVWFVLRKKDSQITGLHVYHHFSVPFFGWIYFRSNAVNSILIPFALMNTFIHTVMYGYYALSALGPQMAPYLWWKKYITQGQILQFIVLFLHGVYFLSRQEGYSAFILGNYQLNAAIYMILFTRFYFKTYESKGTNAPAFKKESALEGLKEKLHNVTQNNNNIEKEKSI